MRQRHISAQTTVLAHMYHLCANLLLVTSLLLNNATFAADRYESSVPQDNPRKKSCDSTSQPEQCCSNQTKQDCCSTGNPNPEKLSAKENEVRKYVYNFIIDNKRAPAVQDIQKSFKSSKKPEVEKILNKLCASGFIDLEGDEIIAAFPFSPKPTRIKVILQDGRFAYSMCAWDALGISKMMKQDVTVEATTPLDQKQIKVIFKKEKMTKVFPSIALIWFSENEGSFAKKLCGEINFFSNEKELDRWKEKNPTYKGKRMTIEEALKQSQAQFGVY